MASSVRLTWSVRTNSIKHTSSLWAEPLSPVWFIRSTGNNNSSMPSIFPQPVGFHCLSKVGFPSSWFAYSLLASLLWFGSGSLPLCALGSRVHHHPHAFIKQKKTSYSCLILLAFHQKIDCSEFLLPRDACPLSIVSFCCRCKLSAMPVKSLSVIKYEE